MATRALRRGMDAVAERMYDADGTVTPPLPVSNAGLELDRYLQYAEAGGDEKRHRDALFSRVCGNPIPSLYHRALDRWEAHLAETYGDLVVKKALRSVGPVVVGLGGESVHESSIRLHRLYGTPIIPGSALKGLARAFVRHEYGDSVAQLIPRVLVDGEDAPPPNAHTVVFGDTLDAGHIVWCDAWYVPGPDDVDRPLRRDVITVHHPRYYTSQGSTDENPPWDFDDPNPNPFISARGSFLVAVAGPTPEWAAFAWGLLVNALADYGVGAKSSSGYGRFRPPPAERSGAALDLMARIDGLHELADRQARREEIGAIYARWQQLRDEDRHDGLDVAKHFIVVMRQRYPNWTNDMPGKPLLRWVQQHEPGWSP